MASISLRNLKDGTQTFQAMIRVKGQKTIIRTFDKMEDAGKFVGLIEPKLKAEKKKKERSFQIERKKNPTYADFMHEDLATLLREFLQSDRAIDRHKNAAPTMLRNVGLVEIGQIKKAWVKAYICKMRKKMTRRGTIFSYESISTHMGIMALAIKWKAEELDLTIPRLPFSTTLFPKDWDTKRERRLSPVEESIIMSKFRRFKKDSRYHWRLLFRLALETGARLQEMVLADWNEFDIERRLWIMPATHTKTKTTRAVPLTKAATRIMRLLRLLADQKSMKVFHPFGTTDAVSSGFHRLILDVGIVDFRFHDLRHEAISRMVLYKRKLSVFEIMKIVGHSSPEMLARYANIRGDEMVDRMD